MATCFLGVSALASTRRRQINSRASSTGALSTLGFALVTSTRKRTNFGLAHKRQQQLAPALILMELSSDSRPLVSSNKNSTRTKIERRVSRPTGRSGACVYWASVVQLTRAGQLASQPVSQSVGRPHEVRPSNRLDIALSLQVEGRKMILGRGLRVHA